MPQELFTNNATTTLNGAINNSVTSLVLTSASLFPAFGNFRLRIDDEIILVTAISGATCTVVRGVEGTAAASHADLAQVRHVLTAGALEAMLGTLVLKTADEDVSNAGTGTTLQDDNHLFTPALVSGAYYLFEAFLIVRNPVATGGNFKFAFGEDATARGTLVAQGVTTGSAASGQAALCSLGATTQTQSSTAFQPVWVRGVYVSAGGVLKLQWAQGTASANVLRLHAGSWLRWRLA